MPSPTSEVINGTPSIKEDIKFDINNDGKVDKKDVSLAAKVLRGAKVDINGDGKVDKKDKCLGAKILRKAKKINEGK